MSRYVGGHPAWSKPNITGDETCLYRCYDEHDTLVYIGITRDPRRRHQRDRLWPGRDAHRIEWTWVSHHAEARRQEKDLIETHRPVWNQMHNRDMPDECGEANG